MRQVVTKILRETAPCASRRHDGEPRTPAVRHGYLLCESCLDGVETALVDLPTWYARSEHELQAGHHHFAQRVSHTPEHGIRLREDVVRVRSDVVDTLSSWCALVVAQRGVAGPRRPAVALMTGFLAVHLVWLTAQDGAVDFADDLIALDEAVRKAVQPEPEAPASLGPCPWPGCGEQLHAAAGAKTGVLNRQIACAAGHRWPPDQWLTLNRELAFTQERDEDRNTVDPNSADDVDQELI